MKKSFIIIVLAVIHMAVVAQTVNVHFKNGQIVQYNSTNVEYIDFTTSEEMPIDITQIFGEWVCTQSEDYVNGQTYKDQIKDMHVILNYDGTYTSTSSFLGTNGSYIFNGNNIVITSNIGRVLTVSITIDGNKMIWNGSTSGITFTYVFEKYVIPLNINQVYGEWLCKQSVDYTNGNTNKNIYEGKGVNINNNGTYTSTLSALGESGTYVVYGNTLILTSSSGSFFAVMVTISNGKMTWSGNNNGTYYLYTFEKKVIDLTGPWEGHTHAYHEYNGQRYQSTRSVLSFGLNPNMYTQGTGYWVDYYSDYGWGRNYIANHIDWKVKGGIIYIHFREDHYDIEIHDYRLYNDHFVGTIYTSDSNIDFSLYKTSDRNWNDYEYDDDYYYSRETRAGSDAAAEASDAIGTEE